jgi:hypothetical protein
VEAAPVRLGEARLKRAVRDVLAADELRIPIETPTTAQLELEVDDGDNPPLDLLSVEAELAELPFIYLESEKGGTLVARWGQSALDAPRYDLESARERAARGAASLGAWGEARPASAESEALGWLLRCRASARRSKRRRSATRGRCPTARQGSWRVRSMPPCWLTAREG